MPVCQCAPACCPCCIKRYLVRSAPHLQRMQAPLKILGAMRMPALGLCLWEGEGCVSSRLCENAMGMILSHFSHTPAARSLTLSSHTNTHAKCQQMMRDRGNSTAAYSAYTPLAPLTLLTQLLTCFSHIPHTLKQIQAKCQQMVQVRGSSTAAYSTCPFMQPSVLLS